MSLAGYVTKNGEDLERTFDFARFRVTKKNFTIPSLKRKWDSPEMKGQNEVAPFNDFPCCGFFIPVFSAKAVVILNDFLTKNGELLPVKTKRGNYFAYQTRTIIDGIVNIKKCDDLSSEFVKGIGIYYDIGTLAFYSSRFPKNLSIFRLREFPSQPFVSSDFVERALSNGLQGFGFRQVYPKLTPSQRREERKIHSAKVNLAGKQVDPQKETMKIEFKFKGHYASKQEQKKFQLIVEELQELLVLKNPTDDFFGAIQSSHTVKGSSAIYISTPKAKRLEEYLSEFIRTVTWPIAPTVETKKKPFWQAYKQVFC